MMGGQRHALEVDKPVGQGCSGRWLIGVVLMKVDPLLSMSLGLAVAAGKM